MDVKNLTLAIPTFNNPNQLLECLASLVLNTDFDGDLIVVNNGDPNIGEEPMSDSFHRTIGRKTRVIQMTANAGWAGGVNRALEGIETDLFTMANDDLLFVPDRELWKRTTGWFDYSGIHAENIGGVGPISNYVSGYQNMRTHGLPDAFTAPLLIGFCATYRTELLKEGLDASLPGGDDYDISIRVRQSGYSLLVDRRSFVYHLGAQTGRRVYGEAWDSQDHQMATYNALIRKHGLWTWYACLNGTIREVKGSHRVIPSLENLYHQAKTEPSDIHEHLEILRTYAASCEHITEFGTHDGTSTTAFLAAQPDTLVCYDLVRRSEIDELVKVAGKTRFVFNELNTLDAEIEPTDLLFVDDLHTTDHVGKELDRHAAKVRKYIFFHDTAPVFLRDELTSSKVTPAVSRFLRQHKEWQMIHLAMNNNGLIGIARSFAEAK